MRWFFAVLLLTLGLGLPVYTHEKTIAPATSTQSATPKPTPARRRTTTRRRSRKTSRRTVPKKPPVVKTTPTNAAWPTFTSAAGRFSVLMPGTPTNSKEIVQSDQGPYTSHLISLKNEKNVFLIGWVDYDPAFRFNMQAELEMNRDKFVEGVQAKLIESRTLRIDGYDVIEFSAEHPQWIFRSRVYMVGRRPYQIVIGSLKGMEDLEYVTRFFNSFKINAS